MKRRVDSTISEGLGAEDDDEDVISLERPAKKMAGQSDGVIVGSAIVKLCGQYGVECVPYVKEYVKAMKDAVREA